MKTWYSFRPISYIGLVLVLLGIGMRYLIVTETTLSLIVSVLFLIFGLYLIGRGRKEHGEKLSKHGMQD